MRRFGETKRPWFCAWLPMPDHILIGGVGMLALDCMLLLLELCKTWHLVVLEDST